MSSAEDVGIFSYLLWAVIADRINVTTIELAQQFVKDTETTLEWILAISNANKDADFHELDVVVLGLFLAEATFLLLDRSMKVADKNAIQGTFDWFESTLKDGENKNGDNLPSFISKN